MGVKVPGVIFMKNAERLQKTGDNMENMLKALIVVLENQTELYRSLLDILLNEKKAVVSANLDAVNAARIRKEAILSLIHAGDEKRKDVVVMISDHLGCPSQVPDPDAIGAACGSSLFFEADPVRG